MKKLLFSLTILAVIFSFGVNAVEGNSQDCFKDNLGRPEQIKTCLRKSFQLAKNIENINALLEVNSWKCLQQIVANKKYFGFNTNYPIEQTYKVVLDNNKIVFKYLKGGYWGWMTSQTMIYIADELSSENLSDGGVAYPFYGSVIKMDNGGNLIIEDIASSHIVVNGESDYVGVGPMSKLEGHFSSSLFVTSYKTCLPLYE